MNDECFRGEANIGYCKVEVMDEIRADYIDKRRVKKMFEVMYREVLIYYLNR